MKLHRQLSPILGRVTRHPSTVKAGPVSFSNKQNRNRHQLYCPYARCYIERSMHAETDFHSNTMDFPNNSQTLSAGEPDLLSGLPDGLVGHVLSFLPAKEAARAAVLSRRWRYIFASVHTLSFVQEEGSSSYEASDNDFDYTENNHKTRNAEFVGLINAAFSCRRRCSSGSRDPGLRAFRVKFDTFHQSLAGDADRWLSVAVQHGGAAEIHVDARRQEQRTCVREHSKRYYESYGRQIGEVKDESDGDDGDDFRNPETRDRAYRVPRELFSSSAASVRTLCLGSCFLDLPPDPSFHLNLPSVEKLALIWIPDSGRDIQRLVSACPRLADLTLESCRRLRAVTVLDTRLRKLSLRCCHGARLIVDATELRALEYRGPVPEDSVLTFVGSPPTIVSCDVEFCGRTNPYAEHSFEPTEAELKNLPCFLGWLFANTRWLRLGSFACMGHGIEKCNFSLPLFLCLRQLELKGTLTINSAAEAVMRILEGTPNLEILTLLILPDVDERPRRDAVSYDPKAVIHVPDVLTVIPYRLREINVVHYQGRVPQRSLLKKLLHNASALEELYVVFPKGKYVVQTFLMREIQSWVVNRPPLRVMFA